MILTVQDFNAWELGGVSVRYSPRAITTQALQVTPENIGALSIELRTDLRYNEQGFPYLSIKVARESAEFAEEKTRIYAVRIGDWLVVLWDELHVFRDYEFKNTFQLNEDNSSFVLPPQTIEELRAEEMARRTFLPEELQ